MVSIVMAKLSLGDQLKAETRQANSINTLGASLTKWKAAIVSGGLVRAEERESLAAAVC